MLIKERHKANKGLGFQDNGVTPERDITTCADAHGMIQNKGKGTAGICVNQLYTTEGFDRRQRTLFLPVTINDNYLDGKMIIHPPDRIKKTLKNIRPVRCCCNAH